MKHALRPILFLGLTIAWTSPAVAQSNPLPDWQRIDRLIVKLGSGDFADREAAMKSLTALGGHALDALRSATASRDPEIRIRAEELVRQIALREESKRLLAGKRVRLAFQDTPVAEALGELNRLTGFAWRIHPTELPRFAEARITLHAEDLTTWQAFDQFCGKAGLVVPESGSAAARSAFLTAGTAVTMPTCYAAAIRIRAMTVPMPGWSRTPGVYEVPLPLEISCEPQMQWHGVVDVAILRAVDDKGQELQQCVAKDSPAGDLWDDDIRWMRNRGVWRKQEVLDMSDVGQGKQVQVRIKLGREHASLVKELHGTLVGQMETPPETLLDVPGILRAGGTTVAGKDGSILKIGDVKRDEGGTVQVQVELQSPPGDDLLALNFPGNNRKQLNQVIMMQLRAEMRNGASPVFALRDSTGKTFDLARYNEATSITGGKSQYSSTLHFLPRDGTGEPAKLMLIGRRTVTVEVPFTLKDIPLP